MATMTKPDLRYSILSSHLLLSCTLAVLFSPQLCRCFQVEFDYFNESAAVATGGGWLPAKATWYGSPNGAGSDGGACGYGNLVSQSPFSSFITGMGPSLYKSGQGCGACYLVKCSKYQNRACSGIPVRVVITDFCPGGPCLTDSTHFDLSGTAFGGMAVRGQEARLRNAGVLSITYSRVQCNYGRTPIAFRVDQGSNPFYLAVSIQFQEGDGDLGGVALMQSYSRLGWQPMRHSWGTVWVLNSGPRLRGPFSIRLTSLSTRQVLVARNVIPAAWRPGATYRSSVNFL
ncbi:OLC1v1027129C1 [Oldenlandia corymbosa var. corymbosa]|uniref:OLC1v1027129C1 n=1 Tax=Oldenlandia corymbosa var. corymbosa TaxID=529605 RepID=A0AAV1C990_OLDCO|nr:OLC1v1027129C1 [Oldenlandia corymbosa var. corymbosa]